MFTVHSTSRTNRIESIDFWRGIVLITILCDHIPGDLVEKITFRNFGFSDSAEAFVFLSGVSVALAYHHPLRAFDVWDIFRRCIARAFEIYSVHIALTAAAVGLFGTAYLMFNTPSFLEADGRAFIFHQPIRGALGVLLLTEQLGYFNILPMYIAMLLWSPAALWMARLNPLLALSASFAIYVASRIGFTLPSWPEPGTWFFNPFAWQFIYTLGIVSGVIWRDPPAPRSRPLYWAAMAALAVSAFATTDGFSLMAGLHEAVFSRLDLFKQNLGLARLVHFLLLAYVVSQTPIDAIKQSLLGSELQRLGRHSLAGFALGSILSAAGQIAMQLSKSSMPVLSPFIGLIFAMVGMLGLFLLARYLEARSAKRGPQGGPTRALMVRQQ